MAKTHSTPHQTLAQIRELETRAHPLVICDVDEVLLQFIPHLERYLLTHGVRFKEVAYRLKDNMVHAETGRDLSEHECLQHIYAFFESETGKQEAVPYAAEQLSRLAQYADIIILTNLPGSLKQTREALLRSLGMDYPVITNDGPKGGAVAALSAGREHHPVVFIDDSPTNIVSVAQAIPKVHLVHFIADARFFASSQDLPNVALKSNCWEETGDFIENLLRSALK